MTNIEIEEINGAIKIVIKDEFITVIKNNKDLLKNTNINYFNALIIIVNS